MHNFPEILAPGGSFHSAVAALQHGADAVYVGLKSFSARKGAANLTLDQLRRLKTAAGENKKIYVAMNTVIKKEELKEALQLILELEEIGVDSVIVQDLGLAALIRKYTKLTLHASTQLAVHNPQGVDFLYKKGFTRVVPARELSLQELEALKKHRPEMELEVFIHGALCYGFSGLCMASGHILGRSANRGECGQICRTWFQKGKNKEFSLSLKDLKAGSLVKELKSIGIDSFKIEGRMKSPEYAAYTSEYYKNLLTGSDHNESGIRSALSFSRDTCLGYLKGSQGGARITPHYPSHKGLIAGEIQDFNAKEFKIKLTRDISPRDGLMVLSDEMPPKAEKMACPVSGKKGQTITIRHKLSGRYKKELYQISAHNTAIKEIKESSWKPAKTPVELSIEIHDGILHFTAGEFNTSYKMEMEPSEKPSETETVMNKVFSAGGTTPYSFKIKVNNSTSWSSPYLHNKSLKNIRDQFQEDFLQWKVRMKEEIISSFTLPEPENTPPARKLLTPEGALPFITDFKGRDLTGLKQYKGYYVLPLSPIQFDPGTFLNNFRGFLNSYPDKNFLVGLSNVAHLEYLTRLGARGNLRFFIDYGLYAANPLAVEFFFSLSRKILWVTPWTEEGSKDFIPPLFISRSCYKQNSYGKCPTDCVKRDDSVIMQDKKRYSVITRECISYILSQEIGAEDRG